MEENIFTSRRRKFRLKTPVKFVIKLAMIATKLTAHRWYGILYIEAELAMRFDQHSF